MHSKSDKLNDLYQEIILDHNRRPRYYGPLAVATHTAMGYNKLCGDKIKVFLRVGDNRITNLKFECACCAICKASASIMMEELQGKLLDEVQVCCVKVEKLLSTNTTASIEYDGDLAALAGVSKFPARVRCATLPWHTLENAVFGKS